MTLAITPVLISGAGPTGMTAAIELARFGIPVRLIEKTLAPATTSRAIGVQARTLELLAQRGLANELLRVGNRGEAASVYGGGKRVFRLEFSHLESPYNYLLFVSQAETERVLREELARQGVAIERGVALVALAQPEPAPPGQPVAGVAVTLRHPDGTLEETMASYLIGAEGAHSLVRSSLGLGFEGETHPESYVLADLFLDGDLAEHDFHIFSSEHGFLGLFPLGGRRWRLIASNPLSQPSPDTAPALTEIQRIYDMRSPVPVTFRDMSWSSWFRINSRMVKHLRERQLFLGGDAAHIHSPAGAQGMNTGIQDMINLGWKLALVLQGRAAPELLATYEADRLPVIKSVLSKTEALTDAIGAQSFLFRTLFNHLAPLVVGTELVQKASTTRMSQLGLNYRDSPLSESHAPAGSLRAGDRVPALPVQVLREPQREAGTPREAPLLSLLDPSTFTLLFVNIADSATLYAQVQTVLAGWQGLVHIYAVAPPAGPTGETPAQFTTHFGTEPGLVLVRPDAYVGFLGGNDAVPQLAAYLQKWLPLPVAV